MTKTSFLILFAVVFFDFGCRSDFGRSEAKSITTKQVSIVVPTNGYSAAINSGLGLFHFPVENLNRRWRWQAASADAMEYEWVVEVSINADIYQFGFTRFCNQPKGIVEGSFGELITSGQIDIWKRVAKDSFAVQTNLLGIAAKPYGDGLLIELKEPSILSGMLSAKPTKVKFISGFELYPQNSQVVSVDYR